MDICNNRDIFCCICVFILIGLSTVYTGLGAKSRQTLWGILDIADNARYEADGPFTCIYQR